MEIAFIPSWLLAKLSFDFNKKYHYNILISNLLLIVFFFFFGNKLIGILDFIPHFCIFDKLIGKPCPFCGTTRAFCEISKGSLIEAWSYNKVSLLVALFFIIQIPLRIFALVNLDSTKTVNKISKIMSYSLLALLIIQWIVNIY